MDTRRIIYTRPEDGGVSIIVPTGTVEECIKDVPAGVEYKIIEGSETPNNRVFRNCWKQEGNKVKEDLVKAKEHMHKLRREKRSKEFEPFDEVIMKQIPGKSKDDAEIKRVKIRTKYDDLQVRIDAVENIEDLHYLYNKELK